MLRNYIGRFTTPRVAARNRSDRRRCVLAPLAAVAWQSLMPAASAQSAALHSDAGQPPPVGVGRVERLMDFPSRHVDARHVDVWLPPTYSPQRPCAVLYMHDGQMLFDARTTWNHQAWNAHEAVARLMAQGQIVDTLIVGIWNQGPLRHSEYYPQKFLPHLAEPLRSSFIQQSLAGQPRSDAYLRFLVEELKPAIDRRFSTRADAANTAVMGSSMGGLISVYAMNEYPQVFGAAAGLSTHWVGRHEANSALPLAAFNYLQAHLAPPDGRRLYMDHGTTELDALYPPYQAFINQMVRDRGYVEGRDSMLRVFEGTGHNERAWAARLHIPLQFLLGRA
jgi:enterochelin esterase-like enzyme